MKGRTLLIIVVLMIASRPATAGEILERLFGPYGTHGRNDCCPPLPCCPDNYCAKPLPCLACPPKCVGPDNYCAKPLPCLACPPKCAGPENYCAKPMPCLFCQPAQPFLSCGEPCGCENGGGRCGCGAKGRCGVNGSCGSGGDCGANSAILPLWPAEAAPR